MAQEKRSLKVGAGLEPLDIFSGSWKLDGHQYESPFGAESKIRGTQSYEWLSGGRFMVHRLQGLVGDASMACIEIIGLKANGPGYSVRSFYGDGHQKEWQFNENEGIWTLTGDWQVGDQVFQVRCTTVFATDRGSSTGKWEYSGDGSNWATFWYIRATRMIEDY